MRISLLRSFLAGCCCAAIGLPIVRAQEPTPAPDQPTPAPEQPAPEEPTPAPEQPAEQGAPETPPAEAERRPNRRRRPVVVIEAGTVHPVAGPTIQDGVVVIRGERILAVGKKGEVEVPDGATVQSFPTGHAYPGLVDAWTDAFTDVSVRGDGGLDAGDAVADALRLNDDRGDRLVAAGITTAYVAVASPATLRGQGAVVRPRREGFEVWQGHERAALGLRLTAGPAPSHALQRQQQQQQAAALFDGLEEWKKARTDHEEALKKYEKEFAEYLAWHEKKKEGKPGDKKPEGDAKPAAPGEQAPPASPPAEGGERPRRGRQPRPPGEQPKPSEPPKPNEQPKPEEPPKQDGAGDADLERALGVLLDLLAQEPQPQGPAKQEPKPATGEPAAGGPAGAAKPADQKEGDKKDEAPKRPTYPKAPPRDPQKEALQRVLDGELPLRVEAHRPDELRAALAMQERRQIPAMVLERAFGAAAVAGELAARGVPVVLTDVLPIPMPKAYEDYDPAALPAVLQARGAPFAIASGSMRRAASLPLMAATAVGRGLDRDAALRAITLSPAEILGVAKDTGSLQAGKYADVLVCDRPLFASDSRVLLVLAKGRVEHEVK